MKESLHIWKIGGNVLGNAESLDRVLAVFLRLEGKKILVHGGGKKASQVSESLGLVPRFHEGKRITDADTLEVAVMVYAGWYNKTLVARCQAMGLNALGLSGADAGVILSEKRAVSTVDYGCVGDPVEVNTIAMADFLRRDLVPVCCAVTHDGKGNLLNTNADTIASTLAIAMAPWYAVTLTFCLELPGVLQEVTDSSTLIQNLDLAGFESGRQQGIFHSGMLPKLENAFRALDKGVAKVIICGPETLTDGQGTHITR